MNRPAVIGAPPNDEEKRENLKDSPAFAVFFYPTTIFRKFFLPFFSTTPSPEKVSLV